VDRLASELAARISVYLSVFFAAEPGAGARPGCEEVVGQSQSYEQDVFLERMMIDEAIFFVDPVSGTARSYAELALDVAELPLVTSRLELRNWDEFLVALISGLVRGRRVELGVTNAGPNRKRVSKKEFAAPLSMADLGVTAAEIATPAKLWESLTAARDGRLGIETSGTTGTPKIIWHRLETLTRGVRTGAKQQGNVWGWAYPPTHFAGLQVLFQALANGNRLVRLHGLIPTQIHQVLESQSVTHLSATPTFYRLLSVPDCPVHEHVEAITVGGERLSPELAKRLESVFPKARIRDIFAATETGSLLVGRGDGSFSIPARLAELIRIRDGQLEVHRSLLAESLQQNPGSAGLTPDDFMATGDLVEWLEDGCHFRILGREQEQLNIGGHKVAPSEVEDRVRVWPEVADAQVYGKPNSVIGTILCCDIVLRPGESLTASEVRNRLSNDLVVYKLPGLVNFVESLGTTTTGKQAKRT
jgi:acyl-coenzyme A synthetase/AMP-(fatty) acid ligase